MDYKIENIEERGERPEQVLSCLRKSDLGDEGEFGQIYVIHIKPGAVKGNHYHAKKREWLVCLQGKVEVTLKDRESGEEKVEVLDADDSEVKRLYIPPGLAHCVEAKSPAILLEYSSTEFNPEDDDYIKFNIK
ncbi:MAG: WxcM-like domain-containing protein [Candidatus Woesearchaeota archaeon]|jgi:UDP-2-acetamido-2,6-beta-L-arabino-hexul-4-ose reductase|nr:WxcM-like domain-containing protein [Candidatus Woesearchaeota archaeon]MDP7324168.1 WxcM-like domain-containing protein [Candidatus Woesearchaeota archaeon]MDP7458290.1 WxcM-like domain-containing protein [Candidatus Woesearchaeota archaeon]